MAKRYPRSEAVAAKQYENEPAFVTWSDNDEEGRVIAMATAGKALAEYTSFNHTTSDARFTDFSNILPNISGRPGMTRPGYNFFRPEEASPQFYKHIMVKSHNAYNKVGIIRNVIDLMADFASQGIRIVHPNKRTEKFYRNWFKRVNGPERAERFLNYLYRNGNVYLKRQTAKISIPNQTSMYTATAEGGGQVIQPNVTGPTYDEDDKLKFDENQTKVEKRTIPWKYTFLDPAVVITVGGPLAAFVGRPLYAIELPSTLRRIILAPRNADERSMVKELPPDIIKAAQTKLHYVLDPEKVSAYFYKKDDWNSFAYPMLNAVFDDISMLEKLKLADLAALDGAISNVRIFTLGDLEHKIAPTAAAAAKLAEILQSNMGGGTMDLIWGPDIKLIESKTEIHKFLGEGKYIPTLNAIHAGLGIPQTITGTFGASGTTNNYISLKTLTERLEYGRSVLLTWLNAEAEIVRKAMGFRNAPSFEFDIMSLTDEAAMKKLVLDMVDRNLLSDETAQNLFGINPDMESVRIKREAKAREEGKMVNKAGPFFEPQPDEQLKKIALQSGVVAPSQIGLDLPPKKPGEKSALDFKAMQKKKTPGAKKKGIPGRPKNTKDKTKRKTKTFTPKAKAVLEAWASTAQDNIASLLNPGFLAQYGKKNMRSLSNAEAEEVEKIKFGVLCNLEPLVEINDVVIASALNSTLSTEANQLYNEYVVAFAKHTNRQPNLDELHRMQASIYTSLQENVDE